jgi:hypothetical protein
MDQAQKAEALTLVGMWSLAESSKRTGIPKPTISRWVKAANVTAPKFSREQRILARAQASDRSIVSDTHARAHARVAATIPQRLTHKRTARPASTDPARPAATCRRG